MAGPGAALSCRAQGALAPQLTRQPAAAPKCRGRCRAFTAAAPAAACGGGVHAAAAAAACKQRRRAARGLGLRVRAIGFELPGAENAKSAEKHAEELTKAASSLLLYQGVLKGKPAQAFLSVVQLLQKGSPLALLAAHGELYRLLADGGHASWLDYVLDQAIKGSENPLARAAAAGKPTGHLRAAAAHDLDVLQQLAVAERTLASWVQNTAFGGGVSNAWVEAASSLAPAGAPRPEAVDEWILSGGQAAGATLAAPLSEAQRAGLRAELAGRWKWSEGVELLERYHARHGAGLVSQHRVLAWTGKLQAADVLKGAHELAAAEEAGRVSADQPACATLLAALTAFLQQDPAAAACPPHVAVCGSAPDRWLQTTWALQQLEAQAAAAGGLRTLVLPAGQVGSLADLAWSLSQHPRARFAVVANSGLEGGGAAAGDAAAMLSGYDGFSWPSNALLIAGFSAAPPADLAPVFRHVALRQAAML